MADTDRDQQTEAPTAKRKSEAARNGDVLQSRDWSTALVVAAGAAWIIGAGPWFMGSAKQLIASGLSLDRADIVTFDPGLRVAQLLPGIAGPIFALFGLTLLAAVAGPALLGSLGYRSGAASFKASRINPMSGLKRIFGTQGLIELVKALARVALLGAIGYWLLSSFMPQLMGLKSADVASSLGVAGSQFRATVIAMAIGLVAIAGIDIPAQIFQRNARLRMTKQQVKEEMREADGAPELKQAIRQRQHSILSNSARKAVGEAAVVLTNPTHFAVALRYRPGVDAVPIVVARGRDEVALAIRELAAEKDVPVLNYPQLTRGIYFTTRAGQPIAEDLYLAVAAILAFVFNLDRAMAERAHQPVVTVPAAKSFDENGRKLSD